MPVLLSWLIFLYMRLVGLTSRVLYLHRDIREDAEKQWGGFIYAFWHSRQALLIYLHRGDRVLPLVSKSKDGEIIAQAARRFGIDSIRGSSSRGGVGAVLSMDEVLSSGGRVCFTPDGPRGPASSVAGGVIHLAQRTGRPIVPVASASRRKIVFNSWDRFQVPLPFSRIVMAYGNPVTVSPTDDPADAARRLAEALDAVTRDADLAAGASS